MKIPKHLAIIMDGNGRWAQQKGRPRVYGHVKGTRVAKTIIQECSRAGVQYLTLYAFSTENWFRPQSEVQFLMRLLKKYLKKETENLIKENIRFTVIGDTSRLSNDLKESIQSSIDQTSACTGLNLIFALSYGSRQEILSAVKSMASQVLDGSLKVDEICEDSLQRHLQTSSHPDPDLIIRTSGEQRLSNFLLWQAAYSEFHFTPELWPNFSKEDLFAAFKDYSLRDRRFGAIKSPSAEKSLNENFSH